MAERINSPYISDAIFGSPLEKAEAERNASFQDWLKQRKESIQQQRTDDVRMARINALGNMLYTMVQPVGWAIGGSTASMQPYDDRQYLQAFNRAAKATEDLRNIGDTEAEYRFKLADEKYRRELAMADEERRQKIKDEAEAKTFERRLALAQAQGDIRMDVERLKVQYRLRSKAQGGAKVSKDLQTIFYERAATAWADYVKNYRKREAANIVQQPMMSQEEFLKDFALRSGYDIDDTQETKKAGNQSSNNEDFSGYKRNGSSSNQGGEDFSQYKR